MSFPSNFLWGAATAAHQCEGSFKGDGKGRSVAEPKEFHQPLSDFYHHYADDIKMMEECGIQAFRTSIDWSRIYPERGKINQIGIDYYKDMFKRLRDANIEPIVTLNHFETPYWVLEEFGGWQDKQVIKEFDEYARTCYKEFGQYVKYWLTFNEVNGGTVPHLAAHVLGQEDDTPEEVCWQGLHNQLVASASVTKIAHEMNPEFKVGCMLAYFAIYPKTCHPMDNIKCMQKTNMLHHICGEIYAYGAYPYFANQYFKDHNIDIKLTEEEKVLLKENTVDFISISYYCSDVISRLEDRPIVSGNLVGGVDNEFLEKNGWGWHIDPDGFRWVLNDCYQRYKKPIAVVENGLGAFDTVEDGKIHDSYRIDFLRDNITQMKKAIEDGVDVFAYTMWSIIDIVSVSAHTIQKRYGLIYVDVDDDGNGTFDRFKKDSFDYYKHIIETNGEEL